MKPSLLILLLSLLTACLHQETLIPPDIIPEDKMIDMLVDVHLVEGAYYTTQVYNQDSVMKVTYKGYRTIFNKYKVSQKDFQKSWDFYMLHPELSDPMYEKVVERISIMQAESMSKEKKKFSK